MKFKEALILIVKGLVAFALFLVLGYVVYTFVVA